MTSASRRSLNTSPTAPAGTRAQARRRLRPGLPLRRAVPGRPNSAAIRANCSTSATQHAAAVAAARLRVSCLGTAPATTRGYWLGPSEWASGVARALVVGRAAAFGRVGRPRRQLDRRGVHRAQPHLTPGHALLQQRRHAQQDRRRDLDRLEDHAVGDTGAPADVPAGSAARSRRPPGRRRGSPASPAAQR